MIFEKAIENYAKARKKFYNSLLKEDIANFIEVVDGKDTDLHVDKPVYAIHLVNVVSKRTESL